MLNHQLFFNRLIFVAVSCLLIAFSYFSMLHAASELYGLGTSQNIYNVIIRLIIIGCSVVCLAINHFKIKNTSLNKLVILWVLWMLLSGLVRPEKFFVNLSNVLFWPAIYYLFYYFSLSIKNKRRVFFLLLLIFIEVSIFYYIVTQDKNTNLVNKIASVNHIYYILLLVPWLFLVRNQWTVNVILFVIIVMTINSAKRGAMLAVMTSAVFYVYFYYFKGITRNKNFLLTYILGLVFVVTGYMVFDYYNEKSDGYIVNRFENMDEDQGSGRLEIYSEVWQKITTAPIEYFVMGHGHNEVINNTSMGLSSHNDYLESFYDYGVVGLLLLVSLLVILIRRTFKLFKLDSDYKVAYLSATIIFLFMTSISHIILYPTYIIYLAAFLGYSEAEVSLKLSKR
jgi:O-antigen ligase